MSENTELPYYISHGYELIRVAQKVNAQIAKFKAQESKYHDRKLIARCRPYGLTVEQYQDMLAAQEDKCAICNCPDPTCIDHCHVTGRVRGLLCTRCNTGLGQFKDNIDRLTNAATYLRKAIDNAQG